MRSFARALVVGAAVAGCIEPSLVPCGDLLCPVGYVCTPGGGCAVPADIAACDGLAEGESCTTFAGGTGMCVGGACRSSQCGNGRVDDGEACDDANLMSGDGCRADCGKVEVCDGELDLNEPCDDGNTNPADGCDTCVRTRWAASALIAGETDPKQVGLSWPDDVAIDPNGNIYIADTESHRIRRVDTSGVITTVAGTGVPGFSGDGGPATAAQLEYPHGVAVDGLGNVYIADAYSGRIRRVDGSGTIVTIAGSDNYGVLGDDMPATVGRLEFPTGVAVDGLGNVYIVDRGRHRIRRVDTMGIITTVAGGGVVLGDGGQATAAQLNDPWGVAVEPTSGRFYIADKDNDRIRLVDANGVISTVAGGGTIVGDGGPATSARIERPHRVAVDPAGRLVIAETFEHKIRRVDTNGIITTIAGTTLGFSGDGGPAIAAELEFPDGVAVDSAGLVYIADTTNHRIRKIDANGIINTVAGRGTTGFSGDGGAATAALLNWPSALVAGANNIVYIADTNHVRIRTIELDRSTVTVAGTGDYGYTGDDGPAVAARFGPMYGLARDGQGNLYIADSYNRVVRKVSAAGTITNFAGTGASGTTGDNGPATSATLTFPRGLAVDSVGNVYIADQNRVRRVDSAGVITAFAGGGATLGDNGPATSAQLVQPRGLAVDASDNLYIADAYGGRIRRVSGGTITTVAGTGAAGFSGDNGPATSAVLDSPSGVAIDGQGRVLIADTVNGRIRRVSAGTITTIAGNGEPLGFKAYGDAGPATGAALDEPEGVAVDAAGNIFIADTKNSRIRRIDSAGVITTVAGAVDPEGTGPRSFARLADPRSVVVVPTMTLFAGGSSGTVQAMRTGSSWLEVVAGRYPHSVATGALARFRAEDFSEVGGVAIDELAGLIYLTESASNRIAVVTMVDPANVRSWTIAPLANATGTAGFANGALATARFRGPTGLYLDAATRTLFVADTGNHAIRAIHLMTGQVSTVAGIGATRGYFGDGMAATSALLFEPRALTRCNGELFIADTNNHRVRRIDAAGIITTVLGDGTAASSGEGTPSASFPVSGPQGLGCDALGNLFVTSANSVRLVPVGTGGVVDGTGEVQTIYGRAPRDRFPSSATSCLTGLAVLDATSLQVVDACAGVLVELRRVVEP